MANGNFGGGDGSSSNPFLVEDAADLNAVRNYTNKYFAQVANIDLSAYTNWVPIVSIGNNYNGRGYEIKNLKIIRPTEDFVGLFSQYGTFSYINLVDCDVEGGMYVGGLVGMYNTSSSISNCRIIGHVKGNGHVGLLVGNHANGVITKCLTDGEVTANSSAGGIVGRSQGSSGGINNSVCLASRINRKAGSSNANFGDIVGERSGTITNCYSIDTLQFVQL